jgi:hypothetical protein
MVATRTKTNVPIILLGSFGEKLWVVSIEMSKKYTLAAREN